MANGLEAGDSIKGSDTFKFFRGERAEQSPGDRDVPFSDLVTYLNDPTVLTSVGGGGSDTALAVEVDNNKANIGLLTLNQMILSNVAVKSYSQQAADQFEDETGVTTKTNMTYDGTNDRYSPTGSSVALTFQSDGIDGSQVFTDLTGNATSVTANGDAENSTDLGPTGDPFGGALSSLYCDGTGDSVSFDGGTYDIGTGDFYVVAKVRPDNVTGSKIICGHWQSNNGWYLGLNGSTVEMFVGGVLNISGGTVTALAWNEVALSRNGTSLQLFVNGTRVANTTNAGNFSSTDTVFEIGAENGGTGNPFTGYINLVEYNIGDFGIFDGASYTPLSAPLSSSLPNITFISDNFTALTDPTSADVFLIIDPVTSITLNTDIIVDVSRDGGVNWDQGTLSYDFDYDANYQVWRAEDIDLSTQDSGTDVAVRVTSANTPDFYFKGWLLQWQ